MLNRTSAEFRFSQFCDEVDTLQYAIEKVIGNDDLLDTENAILDGEIDDTCIGYETARVRNEKTRAIWKLLQEFNPDLVPPIPSVEKKPADNRVIARDVAVRYIRMFGGSTEWIQTDADDGYPILIDADDGYPILIDADGETRGKVSMFDKFPVPVNAETLSEIPF